MSGVVVPSEDSVGRLFPLTVAAVLPGAVAGAGDAGWFQALEAALIAGRDGVADADGVLGRLQDPDGLAEPPQPGWWTAGVPGEAPPMMWALPALPPAEYFLLLLDPAHAEEA